MAVTPLELVPCIKNCVIDEPLTSYYLSEFVEGFESIIQSKNTLNLAGIVFVESTVPDYQTLASGVTAGFEVFILDPQRDGVQQINEVLATHQDIPSLHIVSHGSRGCLYLGTAQLSLNTIGYYASAVQQWANALAPEANILIYGCEVASGDRGAAFIEYLSRLTGVNIAASTTKTGNPVLGGNWEFEFTTGAIASPLAFHPAALEVFNSVLAITVSGFAESIYYTGLVNAPAGLTIDLSTGTMFFAARDTNGILYRLTANKTLSTVTQDFTPGSGIYPHIATDIQSSNGFVYTSSGNGELIRVDTNTGISTILTTLPGFGNESGLDISGSKIYITDGTGGANQIWEYDLSTNTAVAKVSGLPSQAFGLEFDAIGNKVYFATEGSGFYVADLATGTYRLISTAPSGMGNFAVDPTGEFLYARVADTILRISVANGSYITFQTGLSSSHEADLAFGRSSSGSGSSLYVVNGNSIIEVSGFAEIPSTAPNNLPVANFTGTNGDDNLAANGIGNLGDDVFHPYRGRDYVNGGPGTDLLIVDYSANSYTATSGPPAGIFSYIVSGPAGFDGYFRAYKDASGNYDEVQFKNIEQFYVVGTHASDTIHGALGNDTLLGNAGNDWIYGGGGNDHLDAGLGAQDSVDGGAGNDLLIVNYSTVNVPSNSLGLDSYIGPSSGSFSGYFRVYNPATGQTNQVNFSNIELFNVTGTTGDDRIMGASNNDTLNGGEGRDLLIGGEGNDVLNGGGGSDTLDGGVGDDTLNAGTGQDSVEGGSGNDLLIVDYSAAPVNSSVPQSLGLQITSSTIQTGPSSFDGSIQVYNPNNGQIDRVEFKSIEQFQLIGSTGNDSLQGTAANDVIHGGKGNDLLLGGAGDDTLNAGTGQDSVDGGSGNDLLIVDYSAAPVNSSAPQGPGLQISSSTTQIGLSSFDGSIQVYNPSNGQTDRVDFKSIEQFQLIGSAGNDSLQGTAANDVIHGGKGNDLLLGGAGDDTLNAGTGQDFIEGGSGNDLLIVDYSATPINASALQSPGLQISSSTTQIGPSSFDGFIQVHNPSNGQTDRVDFKSIEQFQIIGSSGNDSIQGTAANDVIYGGKGNDLLLGGAGDDTLNAGAGQDSVDGGLGNDLLVVDHSAQAISALGSGLQISSSTTQAGPSSFDGSIQVHNPNNGQTDRVEFRSIEQFQIIGSSGNDSIQGTAASDVIHGGKGNDSLLGGAGDDTLNAGTGQDFVDGGLGNDLLIVDYSVAPINSSISRSPGLRISSSTTQTGSSSFGAIQVYNPSNGQIDRVEFVNIEQFQIIGSSGDDSIQGTAANDVINSGRGFDDVDGGLGNDLLMVDYSDYSVSSMTQEGLRIRGNAGGSGGGGFLNIFSPSLELVSRVDFYGIEQFQITGSSGHDLIEGTRGSDVINGGMGNDTLYGQEGDDILNAGIGAQDFVDGGLGNDLLVVDYSAVPANPAGSPNQGIQVLSSVHSSGTNSYSGYFQAYTSSFGQSDRVDFTGIERFQIIGSSRGDWIAGTAGNDNISAGDGDDWIEIRGGIDKVDGGSGSDLLNIDYSANTYAGTVDAPSVQSFIERNEQGALRGYLRSYKDAQGNYDQTNFDHIEQLQVQVNAIANQAATEGNPFTLTLAANIFGQVDSQVGLNYTATLSDNRPLPTWLSFNSATRTFSGTPTDRDTGNLSIKVVASNTAGVKIVDTFDLAIADINNTPTNIGLSSASVEENSPVGTLIGSLSSSDADFNDTHTYQFKLGNGTLSSVNGPFKIVGNQLQVNGSLSYETRASYTLTVRTTDSQGAFLDKTFVVNVVDAPENIITGTEASETFTATDEVDTINAAGGNDTVKATLNTLHPNDSFDGGDGVDTFLLSGGTATDAIAINLSNANQLASLNGAVMPNLLLTGFEHINLQSFAGSAQVTGNDQDNTLTGGTGNDWLSGGAGNDRLDGKLGNDTLQGGAGNDIYYVNSSGDVVLEYANEGTDIVNASVNWVLGEHLENLTLTGSSNLNGTGNALNNVLRGNTGANTLSGEAGNDSLYGGAGNDALYGGQGNDLLDGGLDNDTLHGGIGDDIYYVNSSGDVVTEYANEGTDTVNASVDWVLGEHVEHLTLTGSSNLNGTGNALNNLLRGNTGANILSGEVGNDTLYGGAGNDALYGGEGDDLLFGDAGSDTLRGGSGNDTLYLGKDTNPDQVYYTAGDGADILYQFIRGSAGDQLFFSGISHIDVRTNGTATEFRVGDGLSGNSGFGTGELLVSLKGTVGFTVADINVNLMSTGQLLFS